jgi:hypothetical protein
VARGEEADLHARRRERSVGGARRPHGSAWPLQTLMKPSVGRTEGDGANSTPEGFSYLVGYLLMGLIEPISTAAWVAPTPGTKERTPCLRRAQLILVPPRRLWTSGARGTL